MKSLRAFLFLSIFCAGIFPAVVTAVGWVFYRDQAAGSLLKDAQGQAVGSLLMAQPFQSRSYFWGRPTHADQLNGLSQASNFSMTDKRLRTQIGERTARWQDAHGLALPPPEVLSASASGFDPHISPLAAVLQIERVMTARALTSAEKEAILELIEIHTEGPTFGLFGESRINILRLNLALDQKFPFPGAQL